MRTVYLSEKNSVLNHFLAQIRDVGVQKDSLRFRRNIERIGEVMAYEISRELTYKPVSVQTPLGEKATSEIADSIVLCSVLRAGLPLHLGFLNYFDAAENGFISAYRHHYNNDDDFEIKVEYRAMPSVESKTLLLVDPMLATGKSLIAVLEALLASEKPREIHIAVVIASPEGIALLEKHLPQDCHLWVAALDEKLDDRHYIVPGLGDAGDLAYGKKL